MKRPSRHRQHQRWHSLRETTRLDSTFVSNSIQGSEREAYRVPYCKTNDNAATNLNIKDFKPVWERRAYDRTDGSEEQTRVPLGHGEITANSRLPQWFLLTAFGSNYGT